MADATKTQVTERLIADENVTRVKLNSTISGKAVVKKIIAGDGITISETGIDDGTGDVTINGLVIGDWYEVIEFSFADITPGTAQTYIMDIKAAFDYDIIRSTLEVDTGTLTGVAFKIGSTDITSMDDITVDTGADDTTATGANSVAIGDRVTLVTSTGYSGEPTTLNGHLVIQRI